MAVGPRLNRAVASAAATDLIGRLLSSKLNDNETLRVGGVDAMSEWIDSRSRFWAIAAVAAGVALFIGLELIEEPDLTPAQLLLELLSITPVVMTSVGVALLFRVTRRQRDDHLQVLHDLEIARVQGHRWRSESRSLLNGLGTAINEQFSRWNLTDAEREVALLLLKGLSTKEIAAVRAGRDEPNAS